MSKANVNPDGVERLCFEGEAAHFPDGIRLIGRYRCRGATLLPAHAHAGVFELCFVARGTMSYELGGRRCDIGAGELHLCRPGVSHAGVNDRLSPCLLYWMEIAPERLLPDSAAAGFFQAASDGKIALTVPEHWESDFETLLDECAADRPDRAEMLRVRVGALLIGLAREWTQSGSRRRSFSPPVAAVVTAMRSDEGGRRPLAQVLAVSGLASSATYRRFREEVGYSPHEYRLRLRVALAQRLLADRRVSVTEAALRANFSSSQYFAGVFRKVTGSSPRRWRELFRRKAVDTI